MFIDRIDRVRSHLREFVQEHFQISLDSLVAESPPTVDLGDLAFPFPFELARSLRRSPRQIAEEIAEKIPGLEEVERFEAAGAGYVNVFLDRVAFVEDLGAWLAHPQAASRPGKVIVEHTNINPNKAAHIGHLRNAALGDSFVRLARSVGHEVEVQNYIDNTGVQVADVVVGFRELRNLGLEEVRHIEEPFDSFCWNLYARVSEWLREDESRARYRHEALEAIESGQGEVAELAEHISTRIVAAHLKTMLRLGVQYDVLPRESEILALKFWDQAFRQLRDNNAIVFRESGAHEGCWVMELPEEDGHPADEKIIVRSNGTVTYVGKDIAYQLWKFGLLGKTFRYKPFFTYDDGHQTWVTTGEETNGTSPDFGTGTSVYNVIDVRQSYLQRVVVQGLRRLGYDSEADRSTHFSYEMVALSPSCCEELGIKLSPEDREKPYVEVSGRKGVGVKADDLIDKLIEKSLLEVQQRHPELDPAGERGNRPPDRHRRPALLSPQVHAKFRHCLRFRRSAQLRGRDRPLSSVCGGPIEQDLPQARPVRGELELSRMGAEDGSESGAAGSGPSGPSSLAASVDTGTDGRGDPEIGPESGNLSFGQACFPRSSAVQFLLSQLPHSVRGACPEGRTSDGRGQRPTGTDPGLEPAGN